MKKAILSITTVLSLPVLLSFAETQAPKDIIDTLLSPERQKLCGIPKLNSIERRNLNNIFQILLSGSNLEQSAKLYLENEGWEEVEIIGTRTTDTGEYLVVYCSPWTYILEPQIYSSLTPGRYLGQMGYTSCQIIDYGGELVEFWTEDTE